MAKESADLTSIAGYVAALSRRLRYKLPNDKADEIVAEAEAHLQDRADDLEGSGMTRNAAEAASVAGFGTVASFGRAVAKSAFQDASSVRARWWAAFIGCSLLGFTIALAVGVIHVSVWLSICPWSNLMLSRGAYLGIATFVAFLISAFFGKRPQTALFAGFSALGAILVFAYAGSFKVTEPYHHSVWLKSEIAEHRADPSYEADLAHDVSLLQMGCRAFANGNPIVPPALMSNGAIIVPNINVLPTMGAVSDDALREEPPSAQFDARPRHDPNLVAYHAIWRAAPYKTAATLSEAQKDWCKVGQQWLDVRSDTLRSYQERERWWTKVQALNIHRFSFRSSWHDASIVLMLSLLFLLSDALAAFAGQQLLRLWRNGRRGSYA